MFPYFPNFIQTMAAERTADLRRAAGRNSQAVRELMPRATEEAVHRDYYVLA